MAISRQMATRRSVICATDGGGERDSVTVGNAADGGGGGDDADADADDDADEVRMQTLTAARLRTLTLTVTQQLCAGFRAGGQ